MILKYWKAGNFAGANFYRKASRLFRRSFLFSWNAGCSDHTPTGWCDIFRPSLTGLLVYILYRRLILLYSNYLEGRQTAENHLSHMHMGTWRTHKLSSCFQFRGSRSVHENSENLLHPTKISHYAVCPEFSFIYKSLAGTLTHACTHCMYLQKNKNKK